MSLHTRVCDLLGIEVPIALAGMGGASLPPLAAAISQAGGLGVLGAADCGPDELREWIAEVRRLTDKPFGVNTLMPASVRRGLPHRATDPAPQDRLPEYQDFAREFMQRTSLAEPSAEELAQLRSLGRAERSGPRRFTQEFFEAQIEVVIEQQVPVYAAGLGTPAAWMDRLRAGGTRVMAVIGSVRHARKAVDAGVEVIIAQGSDGGGHNSPVGTMALIPQVVDAIGDVPVLGAGGIGDGRGIAAALMLGAEGAWIGTAFLATQEAAIPDFQKQALLEGGDEATVVTRCWTGKPARVIRGEWTKAWDENGMEPLPMPFQQRVSWPVLSAASVAKRSDVFPGVAGQGMGLIQRVRPARDVFDELVAQTQSALRRADAL